MFKKYTIEWNDFTAVFAVDHSVMTDEKLHEINNFWGDEDLRLDDENGDITMAVLKMLAGVCFNLQVSYDLNTWGVMSRFDWDDDAGVEGWPKMDGTYGIMILSVDKVEFDANDMDAKTETLEQMPPAPKRPKW